MSFVRTACLKLLLIVSMFLVTHPLTASAESQIYFINYSKGAIQRSNLDGTGRKTVAPLPASVPFGMAFDSVSQKLFWSDLTNSSIMRLDADGKNLKAIISGVTQPFGVEISGSKLYYTQAVPQNFGRNITVSTIDGTDQQLFYDPNNPVQPGGPFTGAGWLSVDAKNAKIYWSDLYFNKIFRAPLSDGSAVETVLADTNDNNNNNNNTLSSLAVDPDGGYVYYCNNTSIYRAGLDGTAPTFFLSLPISCLYVAIDSMNGDLYAAAIDSQAHGITKINLKTNAQTTLFPGELIYGLALDLNRTATPATIPLPPVVQISSRDVKITMEKFNFGLLKAASKALATEEAKKKAAPTKFTVLYESTITRTKGPSGETIKKDVTKRTDKKNVLTLKKVKPGTYTSKYRGILVDKKGKKVTTTKFSLTETFVVN